MDSGLMQFLPFVFIFLIMYFLIIRPQQKQQKSLEKMRNELKENDNIVCAGGIHGRVAGFENENNIVKVKVEGNVVIRVDKASITAVSKES
jgi:preprotein translocase subunit YajC